ncbi:unnamed protein product [Malus baccata var. baccata]
MSSVSLNKMNSSRSSTVSERCFDYSASVDCNISSSTNNVPSSTVSAYLRNMQRGCLIQPFGCLIAVDEKNFTVLAYSVNAPEMLDLAPHAVPNIEQQQALTFGADVQTLFRSSGAAALQKAAHVGEVNLLNPILVHSRTSSKPFYAILHRLDVGLVIDLEPVSPSDVPVTAAGALKSYKLAVKAISKLQSLPSGDISLFCDVIVMEVGDLTGYDRIMVYKFHEGEHGEVIAECHRPNLEPYLGLHFPATDIPKASQFLLSVFYMETNSSEFNLGETVEVVINQVMILSQEQQGKIIHDSPAEVSSMLLYGDNLRLQHVLSDFLTNTLLFTPASEGSPIVFRVTPKKERIGMKMHIVLLEFHITHSAWGIPDDLIQDMFHSSHRVSKEGQGLQMSQNMVKTMNGTSKACVSLLSLPELGRQIHVVTCLQVFFEQAHSQLTSLLEHVRHMPVIDEYAAISAATNISES